MNVASVCQGKIDFNLISAVLLKSSLRLIAAFRSSLSIRLGKFNASSHCSRPILVKFIRSADASSLLSKRASLIHPFHVKPDLTREKRHIDALLLKERWNLIQSGTGRKYIKIKNGSIFVSNKLHGKVVDSVYQAVKVASSAEGGLTADDQDRDSSPDRAAPRARSLSPPPDPTSHTE